MIRVIVDLFMWILIVAGVISSLLISTYFFCNTLVEYDWRNIRPATKAAMIIIRVIIILFFCALALNLLSIIITVA